MPENNQWTSAERIGAMLEAAARLDWSTWQARLAEVPEPEQPNVVLTVLVDLAGFVAQLLTQLERDGIKLEPGTLRRHAELPRLEVDFDQPDADERGGTA